MSALATSALCVATSRTTTQSIRYGHKLIHVEIEESPCAVSFRTSVLLPHELTASLAYLYISPIY